MSKKFVVALHGSPQLRDPLTRHFLAKDYRVWHWYADFWLLAEVPDEMTAGTVYREMELAVPLLTFISAMVLEIGGELKYFGRAAKHEAWDWMEEFWGIPDVPSRDEVSYMPNPGPKSQEKSA